jgi:hypothetical protein
MKKIEIDESLLRHLVEEEKLQQRVAGCRLGISTDLLRRTCKKLGIKTQRTGPRSGKDHPNWNGGRRLVGGYWYVYSPDHPNRTKQGSVAEHRLVMESHIGRFLYYGEVVHHINGDPADNRIDNLELFVSNKDHLKKELLGRIPNWTEDGKKKILDSIRRKRPSSEKNRKPVDNNLLYKLVEEDRLIKEEIAEILGLSRTTMTRHCARIGLSVNWKSRRSRLKNSNRRK